MTSFSLENADGFDVENISKKNNMLDSFWITNKSDFITESDMFTRLKEIPLNYIHKVHLQ